MSIFDLIAGMLFFNFITFELYLAVVLICIDRRRQRQRKCGDGGIARIT